MSGSQIITFCLCLTLSVIAVAPRDGMAAEPKTEKFRGWEVRCDGQVDCVAVSVTEGAQLIVATKTDGDTAPAIVVHVPPNARKGDPVAIHPESGPTFQTRIWECSDRFCEARIATEANTTVITRLVADTKGFIAFRLGEDMHVVPFSLADFRKALEAMRQ